MCRSLVEVTPVYMCDQWGFDFNWAHFHDLWCRLNPSVRRVGHRVGVTERFLTIKTAAVGSKRSLSDDRRVDLVRSLALVSAWLLSLKRRYVKNSF